MTNNNVPKYKDPITGELKPMIYLGGGFGYTTPENVPSLLSTLGQYGYGTGVPSEAVQERRAKEMKMRKQGLEFAKQGFSVFTSSIESELQKLAKKKRAIMQRPQFIKVTKTKTRPIQPKVRIPTFQEYFAKAYQKAYEQGGGVLPSQRATSKIAYTTARDLYEQSTSEFKREVLEEYKKSIAQQNRTPTQFLRRRTKTKGRF